MSAQHFNAVIIWQMVRQIQFNPLFLAYKIVITFCESQIGGPTILAHSVHSSYSSQNSQITFTADPYFPS